MLEDLCTLIKDLPHISFAMFSANIPCVIGERYAHPTNCDRYYICSAGTDSLEICQNNLFFNAVTRTCVTQAQANCGERGKLCHGIHCSFSNLIIRDD